MVMTAAVTATTIVRSRRGRRMSEMTTAMTISCLLDEHDADCRDSELVAVMMMMMMMMMVVVLMLLTMSI